MTVAKFVLPRLKRFRRTSVGFPECEDIPSHEIWLYTLDKMIYSFEHAAHENVDLYDLTQGQQRAVREGFDLFGKYFRALWD